MHIVAYLLIIIVNAFQFVVPSQSYRAYENSGICNMVVYFVCTLVFCLIVSQIVTKI